MATQLTKAPILARGTVEKFQEALTTGIFKDLPRTLWGYITEGEHVGEMLFVTPNEHDEDGQFVIHFIKGNNPDYVQRKDELPSASEAITNGLYIVGNDVFTFDGSEFHNVYTGLDDTIADLLGRMAAGELNIEQLQEEMAAHTETLSTYGARLTQVEADIIDLRQIDNGFQDIIDDYSNQLVSLDERMTAAEGVATEQNATITDIADRVEANETAISSLQETVASLEDPDTGYTALATRIDNVETQLSDNYYTKTETIQQINETVTTELADGDSGISQAITNVLNEGDYVTSSDVSTAIADSTYSKTEMDAKLGNLGGETDVTAAIAAAQQAAQDYTDNTFAAIWD